MLLLAGKKAKQRGTCLLFRAIAAAAGNRQPLPASPALCLSCSHRLRVLPDSCKHAALAHWRPPLAGHHLRRVGHHRRLLWVGVASCSGAVWCTALHRAMQWVHPAAAGHYIWIAGCCCCCADLLHLVRPTCTAAGRSIAPRHSWSCACCSALQRCGLLSNSRAFP